VPSFRVLGLLLGAEQAFGRLGDRDEALGLGRLGLGDDELAANARQGAADPQDAVRALGTTTTIRASRRSPGTTPRPAPGWSTRSSAMRTGCWVTYPSRN
jgi:hypothetical protein